MHLADAPAERGLTGTASVWEVWRFSLEQRLDARASSLVVIGRQRGRINEALDVPFMGHESSQKGTRVWGKL